MSAPAIFRPPAVSCRLLLLRCFGHAAISLGEEFAVQQGTDRTCQHFGDRERQPEELNCRSKRENTKPSGTKSTSVRTIVSSELLTLAPTAWKKTGNVSEDGQREFTE